MYEKKPSTINDIIFISVGWTLVFILFFPLLMGVAELWIAMTSEMFEKCFPSLLELSKYCQ